MLKGLEIKIVREVMAGLAFFMQECLVDEVEFITMCIMRRFYG